MKVITAISIAIIAAAAGVGAGRISEIVYRKPLEIVNGCAFYDMDTGDFKWGPKPVVMGMARASDLQPDDKFTLTPVIMPAPKTTRDPLPVVIPKHKPKPPVTINSLTGDPEVKDQTGTGSFTFDHDHPR